MEISTSRKAYTLFSTDHCFYLKTKKSVFSQRSCIRINRLTSKINLMDEQAFDEEVQAIHAKTKEQYALVMGMIIVNQQPYLTLVKDAEPVATLNTQKIFQIKQVEFIPFKHKFLYKSINQGENEKILTFLREQILNGNFYFAYKQDLTLSMGKNMDKSPTQRKYFWNENMLKLFAQYHLPSCWRIPLIEGFVKEIYCQNNHFSFYYASISRRSKFMSGTRFNSRGIDSNCNSSNFVETEQIFTCHNFTFSHISLRGSSPIFWSQQAFGAPIKFSYQDYENENVLEKHYEFLKQEYKAKIVTINLLSKSKSPEKQLKNRFEFYFYRKFNLVLPYVYFDLNEEVNSEDGQKTIDEFISGQKDVIHPPCNFLCVDRHTSKVLCRQQIVCRINCLDCIDRTNVIMSRISLLFLKEAEAYVNGHSNMEQKKLTLNKSYIEAVIELWVELGNRISMLYCGTESVANHLTKKQNNSFFSFLTGGFKSLNRYYNANVNDAFKQHSIDYLLGEKEELSKTKYFEDNITKGVIEEVKYCTYEEVTFYVLTWNSNNVDPQKLNAKDKEKLLNFSVESVDVVIVCLQEMVELSSYNVLLGNNENIMANWRTAIEEHLNMMSTNKPKKYVYLTSKDLVGICTFVFISEKYFQRVFRQDWLEVKTGFKGNLGNKGAIMLFLCIDSSFITVVNCHLAAGQSSQTQRAQDIEFIHNDAITERDKRRFFDKSEYRFFIGDLNFRLDIKNEEVRKILYNVEKQDSQKKLNKSEMQTELHPLLQKDQFYTSNSFGSLSSYREAAIYFFPTYKYLKKQKVYDTKRTPSWCDRILYYSQDKNKLQILRYTDVDCFESDHKPVVGSYKMLIRSEDADKKKKLSEIYMND